MSGAEPLGVRSERTRNPKSEINLVQELNQRLSEKGFGGAGHEARVSGPDVNRRLVGCFLVSKEALTRRQFTSGPRTWSPVPMTKSGSTWRRHERRL